MKKTTKGFALSIALCLMLLLAFPFCAFAENTAYVADDADLLTVQEEANLQAQCEELKTATGWSVVIVTTNTLNGKSPMEYADDYFDYNDYGENGCLFLLSMEDRDWWVSTSGTAIHAITDYTLNTVIPEEIVGKLSSGDYYRAFSDFGTLALRCYTEAQTGDPYDTNNLYIGSDGKEIGASSDDNERFYPIIISLICALVISLVITKMVKSGYKPVRMNASASNYLVDGSLNVTQQYEHFLYSTVSKSARSSSSSGGGSSTHSSSSGSSHGGGGGKF